MKERITQITKKKMKFKIEWLERKETTTGKKKADATIVDEQGKSEDVTIWGDFPNFDNLAPGSEIEGEIKPASDPKYKPSLNAPRTPQKAPGGAYKQKMIEDTMIRKETSIAKFQATKEEGIRMMSAQRDAVLLVTTFYKDRIGNDRVLNQGFSEDEMESILKKKIVEWRDWFLLSKDFNDVPPFE